MVLPSLYGSIVDNVGAGLVGGAGVVPGVSFGSHFALFEPVSYVYFYLLMLADGHHMYTCTNQYGCHFFEGCTAYICFYGW